MQLPVRGVLHLQHEHGIFGGVGVDGGLAEELLVVRDDEVDSCSFGCGQHEVVLQVIRERTVLAR